MKGKFIVLEGGEGSGKSTQAKLIASSLQDSGFKVLVTHEPGSPHLLVTQKIRSLILKNQLDPQTELLLYLADRAEHLEKVIRPALKKGQIVICDRFDGSTLAYQGYGRGLDLNFIKLINNFIKKGTEPDLYILLDLDPQEGLARRYKDKKPLTRFDQEKLSFHKKVQAGFRQLAQLNPSKWVVLDASWSITKIRREILTILEKRLHLKLKDKVVIGLVGPLAAGKTSAAQFLVKNYGFNYFSLSREVRKEAERRGITRKEITRSLLQDIGDDLRKRYGADILAQKVAQKILGSKKRRFIVDGLRHPKEIAFLQKTFSRFYLLAVLAPLRLRFQRIVKRQRKSDPQRWQDFLRIEKREQEESKSYGLKIKDCLKEADFKINNSSSRTALSKKVEEFLKQVGIDG